MEKSSNKQVYIIVGIVALVIALPVVIALVMFLAGFAFYISNAAR
jgi:hypothetical protein